MPIIYSAMFLRNTPATIKYLLQNACHTTPAEKCPLQNARCKTLVEKFHYDQYLSLIGRSSGKVIKPCFSFNRN